MASLIIAIYRSPNMGINWKWFRKLIALGNCYVVFWVILLKFVGNNMDHLNVYYCIKKVSICAFLKVSGVARGWDPFTMTPILLYIIRSNDPSEQWHVPYKTYPYVNHKHCWLHFYQKWYSYLAFQDINILQSWSFWHLNAWKPQPFLKKRQGVQNKSVMMCRFL